MLMFLIPSVGQPFCPPPPPSVELGVYKTVDLFMIETTWSFIFK